MGDQRRFLSGLFNRYNNVMNYYPSSGISRSCPPSWVLGASVNTDPRGGPALSDHPSFSARRRSVNASGGNIVAPPGLSTIRHPGCWKGNEGQCFVNVYRHLLGYKKRDSASMMLVGNGVDSFTTIIRKYVYRFMNRVVSSSNAIVKCLSDNYTVKSSTIWMTWNSILYVC